MAVVLIANTSGEVSGLFLTQRSVAHSWSMPQTFSSGTEPAPGVVVGPAQLGFFETGGEIHYTKGGADQGVIATIGAATFLGLTDTPSSYAGQRGKFVQVTDAEGGLEFFGGVKSNLIAHDGTDYIVVPVPAGDGQVLTSDTLEATGIKWAANGFSGVVPSPTLVGQTLFSADGSTYSLLNIGSSDDVLTVAAGVPVWSAPATPLVGWETSGAEPNADFQPTVGNTAGRLLAIDGASSTVPTISFLGDEDTGVGVQGANILSLICGGVLSMNFQATSMSPKVNMQGASADQPQIRWATDTTLTVPVFMPSRRNAGTGIGGNTSTGASSRLALICNSTTVMQMGDDTIAFYSGVTPVVRAANPGTAVGTDAAVINALITAVANVGITL